MSVKEFLSMTQLSLAVTRVRSAVFFLVCYQEVSRMHPWNRYMWLAKVLERRKKVHFCICYAILQVYGCLHIGRVDELIELVVWVIVKLVGV